MALRIGQSQAASVPAVLPEEELATDAPIEEIPEALVEEPSAGGMGMTDGSAVEWLQEAIDLCKEYQCPEDLAYALEQALVHLIGVTAVGATETSEPDLGAEVPVEGAVPAEPLDDEMV